MAEVVGTVPNAFDSFAPSYDADFSCRASGRRLREAVWRRIAPFIGAGTRALDLGCGTGEDAVWLARAGCEVTAVDASQAMLKETAKKAARSGLHSRVITRLYDLNQAPSFCDRFDFVLSNFGALNCATGLTRLSAALRQAVVPGGIIALNVMGRFCAWETLWHGLHLHRSAFRRWGGRATAAVGGRTIPIRYWSASEIADAFAADFHVESVHGIGVFLPPSYLFSLIERRPTLFEQLSRWEERVPDSVLASHVADHQLTILRRKAQP